MSTVLPIEELKSKIQDAEILLPGSSGYEQSVGRWNAAIKNDPSVVVRPLSTQAISSTLKFRQKHSLKLAVGGGGHFSGDVGCSSGEILLDLSSLNQVTIDKVKEVAVVQGGVLTGDVARAADEHGLIAVLSTVSKVGFTGITLCGGYGHLSGQYGLMTDNLLSAQVTLADGTTVTASPNDNAELFWALRGAGPHVGVVSEVTVRLHKLHNDNKVLAGALMFPPQRAEEVLQVLNEIVPDPTGRGTALLVLAAPPPFLAPMVIVSLFYDGTAVEGRTFFDPLYALKPQMDFTKMMSYATATTLVDWTADHGQRQVMGHGVFRPPLARPTFDSVWQMYREFHEHAPSSVSVEILFEFHQLAKVVEVPDDATAFPNRGPYENIMVAVSYLHESDEPLVKKFVTDVTQLTRRHLMEANHDDSRSPGVYTGYDNQFTDTRAVFGDKKYDRLLSLKAKYDPDGVFNRWYPVDL